MEEVNNQNVVITDLEKLKNQQKEETDVNPLTEEKFQEK